MITTYRTLTHVKHNNETYFLSLSRKTNFPNEQNMNWLGKKQKKSNNSRNELSIVIARYFVFLSRDKATFENKAYNRENNI